MNYQDIVHVEELQIDDAEPLRAELESFVSAVVRGTPPAVTVEEGVAAVETATRIVESISTNTLGGL